LLGLVGLMLFLTLQSQQTERVPLQPSPQLARFLATEDLDDLLDALDDLGPLSGDDEQVVRSLLSSWRDEQAISNLLVHPAVIPAKNRIAALTRGLDEREQPYYVLAAAVGVQGLDPSMLSDTDRAALRDRLLKIIQLDDSIIARRATVSLRVVLTPADAEPVWQLLEHPNETVRHNVLSWLVETFAPDDPSALHRRLDQSAISVEAKIRAKGEVDMSVERRRTGAFDALGRPLLSYIPNLSETR
jgi:HEAT repeat protein